MRTVLAYVCQIEKIYLCVYEEFSGNTYVYIRYTYTKQAYVRTYLCGKGFHRCAYMAVIACIPEVCAHWKLCWPS